MDDESPRIPSGGFVLSPPPSSIASSTIGASSPLPHPRASPLRAGGAKESAFIRYVDSRLLHIQRRFAKRTTPISDSLSNVAREDADVWGDTKGYASMKEACKDIGEVVNLIWVSGTPSLQVPYLINLGVLLGNVVAGMPPTPRALFALLDLLDRAFASLLQGRDIESGEMLPGLGGGRGVSGTEKVRIRSLVERTRVAVMEAFKKGEFEFEEPEEEAQGADDNDDLIIEGDDDRGDMDVDDDDWDMQLARAYDRTLVELGDSLAEPSIGIITEGRG